MTSLYPFNCGGVEEVVLLFLLGSVKQLTYFRGICIPEIKRSPKAHRNTVITASIHKIQIKIINKIRSIQHLISNLRQIPGLLGLQLIRRCNVINMFKLLCYSLRLFMNILVLENFLGALFHLLGFLTIKHGFDKKFLELGLVFPGAPLLVNH